jgi:membrane protein
MLGRYLIGIYIEKSIPAWLYGAGSLIVILVWVYYTAAILYIGAEFTSSFRRFCAVPELNQQIMP